MKKILWTVIVSVLIAGAGYYVWRKQSTQQGVQHFSWQGIEFDYPLSWSAEIIKFASAAMQAEGKTEETGFTLKKESVGAISAGGPQSGGDTCENLKSRRPYAKCADVKSGNNGETMAMTTSDNNPETLTVFNQVLSTFKFTK